jgi:nicotinate-nucleotide adenylyltransferase
MFWRSEKKQAIILTKRRICLLGGTFNPIHNGHLHIAEAVASILQPEIVLFIPSGIPPHKEAGKIPEPRHRLEMARLALRDFPLFQVCDVEMNENRPSYTINTIDLLRRRYFGTQLIFIIGMDAFARIKTWKDSERLLTLCDFAVIARPEHPFSRFPEASSVPLVDQEKLKALDEGRERSYRISISRGTSLYLLSIPPCGISATQIRMRVASGEPVRNVLPRSVESYIIENEVYLEDKNY